MSNNKVINAVVALIEDRPKVAREILRGPEVNLSTSELIGRVYTALQDRERKAAIEALKNVLRSSMRVTHPTQDETFFVGVATVEGIIEDAITELTKAGT